MDNLTDFTLLSVFTGLGEDNTCETNFTRPVESAERRLLNVSEWLDLKANFSGARESVRDEFV